MRTGAIKTVIGTDPAANTETSQTVPAGEWWELKSVCLSLLQGATQTPQPILVIDGGINAESKGTFTVTIASPGVFSKTAHGLNEGDLVSFTTTGALPTGLSASTAYYVVTAGLTVDAFEVSATRGGTAINTSGTQSGTHTLYQIPVFFEGFGATAAQSASTTVHYTWAPGLPNSGLVGSTTNVHATAGLPAGLVLAPGSRITTSTVGIGANSNYGAPIYRVVRYDTMPAYS